jgi:hypothetical protein
VRWRAKGFAYLAGVVALVVVVGVVYGFSLLFIPLSYTFNMGLAGLLVRAGLYCALLAVAVWSVIRHFGRKAAGAKVEKNYTLGVGVVMAVVSLVTISTVRDLFTAPVTRDFEVSFELPRRRTKGNTYRIYMVAEPVDGSGKEIRFETTRFEDIEGVGRFTRRELPRGSYRMRVTYYPHSKTRVETRLIEK